MAERCREWERREQVRPDDPELRREVGRFAESLDAHRTELPVVYYTEWLDRWSMFNTFSEPFAARGGSVLRATGRFDLVCCTDRPAEMLTLPAGGWQWDEQAWLAARLREVATAWEGMGGSSLVLLRAASAPSTEDEEVTAAMAGDPEWLTT